ncbi:hypothetical protein PtrSN002B_002213 [Pyrenophora tritici-repentis]|uniref:F-box domain-containing protein n=1 Tax=Pyrenophora tritici-repentis TaxID=45151 RepID=A0A2W1DC42_9PLEO|nr:hypothetical protein PtrV1_06652 [Pyrenophora tritici-repentis]KAF7447702.1 hypothetical protein A1F99_070660 [Pyrenophora tritici-repentis]KAF7571392.1 hypothetical protein PtrM4_088920 [Pyrenophora tritici-repentis]KAI0589424.1 hypothetical protein Alg130_02923 [Pyrenophora tritici-repentis]KAI0609893.1 hypothetical protein TUN205_05871 [Pyrenophora tritici-repentis]
MGTLLSVATVLIQEQKTIENQSKSPLLRLPAELRNQIYETAFSGGRIRVRVTNIHTKDVHTQQTAGALALRATCRQIRSESDSIFYEQYIFYFSKTNKFEPIDIAKGFMIDNYQRIERIAVNLRLGFFIWLHMDDENPNELDRLFPCLKHFYTLKPALVITAMAHAFGKTDLEIHEAKFLMEDEDFLGDEDEEDDKDDE